jgi:hypothetical protein
MRFSNSCALNIATASQVIISRCNVNNFTQGGNDTIGIIFTANYTGSGSITLEFTVLYKFANAATSDGAVCYFDCSAGDLVVSNCTIKNVDFYYTDSYGGAFRIIV